MTQAYLEAASLVEKIGEAFSAAKGDNGIDLPAQFDVLVQYLLLCSALTDGEFEGAELSVVEEYTTRVSVLDRLSKELGMALSWGDLAGLNKDSSEKVLAILKKLYFNDIVSFATVIAFADKATSAQFGKMLCHKLGVLISDIILADGEFNEEEIVANADILVNNFYSIYLAAVDYINRQ